MPFRPNVHDTLRLNGLTYRIAEHPAAPGLPYGQTGRRGTVYQLLADAPRALKVFTPAFRTPRTVEMVGRLAPFTKLSGLQVCAREVLAPDTHAALLAQEPDLTYAVVMPWVAGETWQELVLDARALTVDQSLGLATRLAAVLAAMERHGIAHCDLSGPNLLLTVTPADVSVVDVEDLFIPGAEPPEKLPGGSSGYAHRTAQQGLWHAAADRFAAAVLLAEILGWCDQRIRDAAAGEQFFDPHEMQDDGARCHLLRDVLETRWGHSIADAFTSAWHSSAIERCPSLADWDELLGAHSASAAAVPAEDRTVRAQPARERLARATIERAEALLELDEVDRALAELEEAHRLAPAAAAPAYARALFARGARQEQAGELAAAIKDYTAARTIAPPGSLRDELAAVLDDLAKRDARGQRSSVERCRSCQRSVQADWMQCPYCGSPLGAAGAVAPPAADRPGRPRWSIAALVAGLLLLIGGAAVAGWAMAGASTAAVPTVAATAAAAAAVATATSPPTAEPTAAPTERPTSTPAPPSATAAPALAAAPPTDSPIPATRTPVPPTKTKAPTARPPTSTPAPQMAMPNLVGRNVEDAIVLLVALGINHSAIMIDPQSRSKLGDLFDSFAPGTVVSTAPGGGAMLTPGQSIVLGVRAEVDDLAPTPTPTPTHKPASKPKPKPNCGGSYPPPGC